MGIFTNGVMIEVLYFKDRLAPEDVSLSRNKKASTERNMSERSNLC